MSASSLSSTGSPQPTGTPVAIAVTCAPTESPVLRKRSMNSSSCGHDVRIGAEERIAVHAVPGSERHRDRPELRQIAAHLDAMALAQPLLRDGAGRDAHGGFARGLAAAAAIVADAVLLPVRVVRVAGTERLLDRAVILAALVGVADQQSDRRAGRAALEHAREDLDRVALLALGHEPRRPGFAAIQFPLDVGFGERHAGRAAIHHATDRRPVAFTERGHAEEPPQRVTRHRLSLRK